MTSVPKATSISRVCIFVAAVCSVSIHAIGYGQTRDTVYRDSIVRHVVLVGANPASVTAEGGYNKHFISEGALPALLANGCDTFRISSSAGVALSTSLAIPLSDALYLAPSLFYRDLGSEHTFGEFFTDTTRIGSDSLVRTTVPFEHTIQAPSKAIGIGISLGIRFFERLFAEVGFEGAIVIDKSYEKHLQPTGPGGFSDGSRDSLESSGELPEIRSFLPSIRASLGAEFPLSSRLFAAPAITVGLPLTGLTPYWNFVSLGGGLKLRYLLSAPEKEEQISDTIRIATTRERPSGKPKLEAEIHAVGITKDGREEEAIGLDVEQVKARVAFPMLNYIFFDEGSSRIPSRYQQFPSAEEAKANFKGTLNRAGEKLLSLYWESLNILGARLAANPEARITLIGSTSNSGPEKNAIELARARAQTVKDYLSRIWNILPERIRIEARLLPEKPSPSNILQGMEENRRVEILSSDERITDPIMVTNVEHLATPSEIKLRVKIGSEVGLSRSIATVSIAGTELIRYEGSVARQKAWTITEEALTAPADSLDLRLEVTDSAGNTVVAKNSIPLVRRRSERERPEALERYSLILFGFDEDVLGKKNERIIRFVGETFKRLRPQGITIFGYTDELGDPQHNDELSLRRAESASRSLERILGEFRIDLPRNMIIEGKGSRERLYDNSLPEGRFFSRTVNITVEKRE